MDPESIDERVHPAETQQPSKQHLDLVASSFQELFTLLEEYAPVWYTEQHHKRAVRAQRALRQI